MRNIGGLEFGTFDMGLRQPAGGPGQSDALLRQMLQRMGAPASFWENIPVPITDDILSQIPSQRYQDVVSNRREKIARERSELSDPEQTTPTKECNQECNICLMQFEDSDMVRVFPCCELAQHTDCLAEWFKTHDNCIVCRKKTSDLLAGTPTGPAISTPAPPSPSVPRAPYRRDTGRGSFAHFLDSLFNENQDTMEPSNSNIHRPD
jgi:hypothetical protein